MITMKMWQPLIKRLPRIERIALLKDYLSALDHGSSVNVLELVQIYNVSPSTIYREVRKRDNISTRRNKIDEKRLLNLLERHTVMQVSKFAKETGLTPASRQGLYNLIERSKKNGVNGKADK